jgi:hypothetical protein
MVHSAGVSVGADTVSETGFGTVEEAASGVATMLVAAIVAATKSARTTFFTPQSSRLGRKTVSNAPERGS